MSNTSDDLKVYVASQGLQDYLPDYYENSRQMTNLIAAEQTKMDGLGNDINDVVLQNFIGFATWGLDTWEQMFGIPTDTSKSDDQRRAVLLGHLQNVNLATVQQLETIVNSFIKSSYSTNVYAPGATDVVPLMTAANAPAPYVITESSINTTGFEGWHAFNDASIGDCWATAGGTSTGWVTVDLGSGNSKVIIKYDVGARNASNSANLNAAPKNWTFEGSNDNSTWTVLDTRTNQTNWSAAETRSYNFVNNTPYRYYRFNVSANNGYNGFLAVGELAYYEKVVTTQAITNNKTSTVVDHPTQYTFDCIFPLDDIYYSLMINAIENARPAHLQPNYIAQANVTENLNISFKTYNYGYLRCGSFACGSSIIGGTN